MQFIAAASLFAVALAAPAPQASGAPTCPEVYENINVTEFSLRKNNGSIQSVSFKMTGDTAKEPILCSIGESPSFPSEMVTCDDGKSKYRVVLIAPKDGSTEPEMAMYHETGPAVGLWNETPLPPNYCHAGGNGPDDFICAQIPETYTFILTRSGPFECTNQQ